MSENEYVIKDTFYDRNSNQKSKIRFINDTSFTGLIILDTVFNIIKGDVLKKHKGYYFLNTKWEQTWAVEKLSLAKGFLHINSIKTGNDLILMETITTLKKTQQYHSKLNQQKSNFRNLSNETALVKARFIGRSKFVVELFW